MLHSMNDDLLLLYDTADDGMMADAERAGGAARASLGLVRHA